MIEKAAGFEVGAPISESGSFFNQLMLPLQFFMSFVRFMLFMSRLLESPPCIGILSGEPTGRFTG